MSKEKKELLRRILILSGAGLFVLAFFLAFYLNHLIPSLLAEFAAASLLFALNEKDLLAVLFIALSIVFVVALIVSAFAKEKVRLIASIVSVVFLSADFVLHMYAFIAAGGYQWNYLISAILDSAVAVCVLYKPKEAEK